MTEFGIALSGEEHRPGDLVRYARLAEEAGFTFALVSDHYHPWIDRQGQSVFVWSVLGGIAQATERLSIGTGVTCPLIRIHPAIIAQAAATVAAMMPGRFFLGVGTGENLNEHILGDRWPPIGVRRAMLREAVEVMRGLWTGKPFDHHGRHYAVEGARIYTLPDEPPPVYVAAAGPASAALAGKIGDGLIVGAPDKKLLERFASAGGEGKPRYGQVTVCWAEDEASARHMVLELWPNAGLPGELTVELPLPRHFEQAAKLVTEDVLAAQIVCGPDPDRHVAEVRKFIEAGYDHVYVHQIGPEQEAFLRFYQREVLPLVGGERTEVGGRAAAG